MKDRTRRRLARWDIHHLYWQDIVALLGGVWLVATVLANVSPAPVVSGWLAFLGGALAVIVGAGTFQDDSPALSWTVAVGGLLAVIGAVISLAYGQMFAFWSLAIGGGVVLFLEVWSGALKKRETRREARRVEHNEPVRA
jgi:peptidoglycan/LPS O-acetylase OafA/YrhL